MNRRDRRANGQRSSLLYTEPVRAVVEHARSRGCLCDPPGIRFTGPPRPDTIEMVAVEHDAGCPLAPHGPARAWGWL